MKLKLSKITINLSLKMATVSVSMSKRFSREIPQSTSYYIFTGLLPVALYDSEDTIDEDSLSESEDDSPPPPELPIKLPTSPSPVNHSLITRDITTSD